MDPREVAQLIIDALRRHGYDADIRSVDVSTPASEFLMIGGRREFSRGSPSHYEMSLDLIIDGRSLDERRRREEWERRRYEFGSEMNPAVAAGELTHQQIGEYFRDGLIPDVPVAPPRLRASNGTFAARPRVAFIDAFALVRSLRMPVAFIDVWALVRMLVGIADECGDALVRASLLEYE